MKNQVILFQGDSITDCGRSRDANVPNAGLGGGYPFMTAAHLLCAKAEDGFKFFNRGISGNRIVDLYARWKVDGLNLNPDVISILIGVNDTWHAFGSNNGVEVPRYEQFYRMLLEWTVQTRPEAKLVLCEPFVYVCGAVSPEWVPEINQRREVVCKMAKEFDAIFIPYQEIFDAALKRAPAEYWLCDGVHPTLAGHQLMSEAWLKATAGII
ncbi:MAG: SGNH/GDSL hydrolase family protein [Lentisphaerota bacterium]